MPFLTAPGSISHLPITAWIHDVRFSYSSCKWRCWKNKYFCVFCEQDLSLPSSVGNISVRDLNKSKLYSDYSCKVFCKKFLKRNRRQLHHFLCSMGEKFYSLSSNDQEIIWKIPSACIFLRNQAQQTYAWLALQKHLSSKFHFSNTFCS